MPALSGLYWSWRLLCTKVQTVPAAASPPPGHAPAHGARYPGTMPLSGMHESVLAFIRDTQAYGSKVCSSSRISCAGVTICSMTRHVSEIGMIHALPAPISLTTCACRTAPPRPGSSESPNCSNCGA